MFRNHQGLFSQQYKTMSFFVECDTSLCDLRCSQMQDYFYPDKRKSYSGFLELETVKHRVLVTVSVKDLAAEKVLQYWTVLWHPKPLFSAMERYKSMSHKSIVLPVFNNLKCLPFSIPYAISFLINVSRFTLMECLGLVGMRPEKIQEQVSQRLPLSIVSLILFSGDGSKESND